MNKENKQPEPQELIECDYCGAQVPAVQIEKLDGGNACETCYEQETSD